jgi:hypothetical protein
VHTAMTTDSEDGSMHRRVRWAYAVAVLAAVGGFAACGSDSTSGPEFGDLAFAPADTIVLGATRETMATVSNVGTIGVSQIVLGANLAVGRPPLEPDIFCDFRTTIVPSQIASLSPGASAGLDISVDDTNVDVRNCLAGDYDIRILASGNNLNLGTVTVRVTWDPPE